MTAMTYEELNKQTAALDKEKEKALNKYYKQMDKVKAYYIEEHKPLHVKRFQRICVRLRVTEESRKWMDERHKKMAKNQAGREYTLTGPFNGWGIAKDGQLKPCFYGDPSYPSTDEVVSVELAKDQPEGDCSKCRCYKDGLCYMMGGKDLGKSCAVWKITDDMVPCPKYEEVMEGGLYEYGDKHCPNVTKVMRKGQVFYRVYSLNWQYFTEYSESELAYYYTKEPKKAAI